jgi:hypothetical protein
MLTNSTLIKLNPSEPLSLPHYNELSENAKLLLKPEHSIAEIIEILTANELHTDVVKIFAYRLPTREAIWWSYCCALEAERVAENKDALDTLQIVKQWIYQPGESLRRAAEVASQKLEFKTPSSWVATAVFWSGGSIAPVDSPEVFISQQHLGRAVTGAVMLATALNNPNNVEANYKHYLTLALDIANGGNGGLDGTTRSASY